MRFAWDENKNRSNQRKHGVSFETAKLVFDDPLHLTRLERIENGEERWQTLGLAGRCGIAPGRTYRHRVGRGQHPDPHHFRAQSGSHRTEDL